MNKEPDFRVIKRGASEAVTVEGELTEANAEEFERQMNELVREPGEKITLDLYGLDIEDGIALATFINSLRGLLALNARLVLKGAPQMLGHNLYRVGLLDSDAITLIDMRLDEPSGI
ncbi:MAG TPA: STAS domain-containing protein [Blastocatellia bacterium]|nr:STAS domain-containing protein [Blastocatellia bacterium]